MPNKKQKDGPELPREDLALVVQEIDAEQLVSFLRYAGDLTETILQGFRLSKQSVNSPVVRQRLVKESLKDGILRDTLVILWREGVPPQLIAAVDGLAARELEAQLPELAKSFGGETVRLLLLLDSRAGVRRLSTKWNDKLTAIEQEPPPCFVPKPPPAKDDARKAPDDGRLRKAREERAAALEQVRLLKPQIAEARKLAEKDRAAAHAVQKELDRTKKLAETLQRKLEREGKARHAVEAEAAELKQAVKALGKAAAAKPVQAKPEPQPRVDLWPDVIARMLNNGQHSAAIVFCEEVIRRHPDDTRAHALLCRAYLETKQPDMALGECWWMADRLIAAGQMSNAAHYICTAFGLDLQSKRNTAILDRLLKKLDLRDEAVIHEVRRVFLRYAKRSPENYKAISAVIARAGKQYQLALEGHTSAGPDTMFSFESGGQRLSLSVRGVIDAINCNNTNIVEFLRAALRNMKTTQSTEYRKVLDAVESSDPSCAPVLRKRTNPIVVDGSNVAFAYTTTSKKPRLNSILLLRKTLRNQGYFPIYIYADASLRHQIDQPSVFDRMVDTQEVSPVDSGRDADETILFEARRLKCPVVTNDRMLEWDPDGQVEKLKFDADARSVELRPQWDLR